MSKKIEKSYRESDEYKSLIDDCKSTLVEGIFNARMDVIITHGKIGERVATDKLYKKYGKGRRPGLIKALTENKGVMQCSNYNSFGK